MHCGFVMAIVLEAMIFSSNGRWVLSQYMSFLLLPCIPCFKILIRALDHVIRFDHNLPTISKFLLPRSNFKFTTPRLVSPFLLVVDSSINEHRLIRHLLDSSRYDPSVRPVVDDNHAVNVTFNIAIFQLIEIVSVFDNYGNVLFSIHPFLILEEFISTKSSQFQYVLFFTDLLLRLERKRPSHGSFCVD